MTIAERIRGRLVAQERPATIGNVALALREEGVVLGDRGVLDLADTLRREFAGAGLLDDLLHLPDVTDVIVNAPDAVWVDRGDGLERSDVAFASEDEVRRLAQRLAASAGRRLDDAHPYVDARLPDGSRLHAVLRPVAVDGTLISLRVPRQRAFTLDELVAAGSLTIPMRGWLDALIRARLAFLVSGGTGSGKTTILSALLGQVPGDERIVIVEDAVELQPTHPHITRLQARRPNIEGAGEVTMRELVRQSLRMRPDRIVVGEVRGVEVTDLLTALNTGHEGGCGTIHANAPDDVPARLEALGLMAGLDRRATHALAAAGLDAIVHITRNRGARAVDAIAVLERDEDGMVHAVTAVDRTGEQAGAAALRARLAARHVEVDDVEANGVEADDIEVAS